jgi:hypothetical protein
MELVACELELAQRVLAGSRGEPMDKFFDLVTCPGQVVKGEQFLHRLEVVTLHQPQRNEESLPDFGIRQVYSLRAQS